MSENKKMSSFSIRKIESPNSLLV